MLQVQQGKAVAILAAQVKLLVMRMVEPNADRKAQYFLVVLNRVLCLRRVADKLRQRRRA